MSAPKKPSTPEAPAIELTLTDHFLQVVKAALEFNAQVIELATEVIAMDSSGHNKTMVRRVHEQFVSMNKNYSKQVDETNRRIVEQFLPKISTAEKSEESTP